MPSVDPTSPCFAVHRLPVARNPRPWRICLQYVYVLDCGQGIALGKRMPCEGRATRTSASLSLHSLRWEATEVQAGSESESPKPGCGVGNVRLACLDLLRRLLKRLAGHATPHPTLGGCNVANHCRLSSLRCTRVGRCQVLHCLRPTPFERPHLRALQSQTPGWLMTAPMAAPRRSSPA